MDHVSVQCHVRSTVCLCIPLQLESTSKDELLEDPTPTTEDVGVIPADICVVDTAVEARRVVNLLRTTYKTQDWFFACDTEVRPFLEPMQLIKAVTISTMHLCAS